MLKPIVLISHPFAQPVANLVSDHLQVVNDVTEQSLSLVRGMVSTVWDNLNKQYLDKFPSLEIISHLATGADCIDIEAAKARNILITNTPDVVTDDTADLAMALLLCLARNIVVNDNYVRDNNWGVKPYALGSSLKDKRLGIVGLGNIGMQIAKRAEAFNMTISYCGPRKNLNVSYNYVNSLTELALWSDYLMISCAANIETKHLINLDILQALGKKGYLINISRGFIVNQSDLLYALQNNLIGGAGLDVFENEPNVSAELMSMQHVVLSPHAGSATKEARTAMYQLTADNLLSYFKNGSVVSPI